MSETAVVLAIAAPAILLVVVLYWLDRVRRREALFRWAADEGFKLRSYHQPVLTELSPCPFSASKSQQVFRVEVEDPKGQHRLGWVRLGSAWRGLHSRAADVRWDAS